MHLVVNQLSKSANGGAEALEFFSGQQLGNPVYIGLVRCEYPPKVQQFENPSSLRGLLELVDSKQYPSRGKTRPNRRDGPLREPNVSDEEVREIQAATHEVFPGSIVNIFAVVTGCLCEEGWACSDQLLHSVRGAILCRFATGV
jgi:hypothetical protein